MTVFQFSKLSDDSLRDLVSRGEFKRIRYFADGQSRETDIKEWIRLKRPQFAHAKELGL